MTRSHSSRKQKPFTKFKFKIAYLVWDYDWDYGPAASSRYFPPSCARVFHNLTDAELYAKEHGDLDVDEIQCAVQRVMSG